LKNRRQNFKVVVGEQDMEKTLANIEFLIENDINFVSVPDYMLSNLEDEIDMCFFGALTLKSTFDFVTSNGTNALISQFSQLQKPIYLFLTSSKFSLWEADKKQSVNQHQHKRKHPLKDLTFDRIKFSHDRVPADKVTYTVTEEGVLNNANLKEVYNRKFEEHKLITDKLQSLGDNFYET
jgi:translation initiation factor 2B subunit (eIF-2B alpha/beta/delta family)